MASHQKVRDIQIAQIAEQVSSLSRPQGQLPDQPKANPRVHISVVYTKDEGFVESSVMVLQEMVKVPISVGTTKLKKDGAPSPEEEGHQSPQV